MRSEGPTMARVASKEGVASSKLARWPSPHIALCHPRPSHEAPASASLPDLATSRTLGSGLHASPPSGVTWSSILSQQHKTG